ncbi:sirohydrochlorin ferrochelatase [Agromyces terreus]|uniref:Sirohydrochlorin ferrochelatase n=1 Tax=Agromyces terreus TaxID=424795 RepID=A0A9X2H448_9MICO|nr:CbiX/SirB N-terminal domain-containing protein [Agromyces terreus]MCP2372228.1 sirohydrochlorin ferrochelatase [Agromyces terreus]
MAGSNGIDLPTEFVADGPAVRLVAVTHGEPSAANRAAVARLVEQVAEASDGREVTISFVDASTADVASAVADAADAESVIVPLTLSAGYHVRTGLSFGLERIGAAARLAGELGPDDRLVGILAERLAEAGLDPRDQVLLAAAGSNDPRAVRECFETARRLGHRLGRAVTVGFIAAAIPRLPDAIEMIREVHPGTRIVVAPYLLAPGAFYDSVLAAGADVVASPLIAHGGSAPRGLVDVVLDRYEGVASDRLRFA